MSVSNTIYLFTIPFMFLFLFFLFVLGAIFGSFSSVVIYRLKHKQSWILTGRSECPHCKHRLWFLDLFPIVSYIFSWWKCRYCQTKIPIYYPSLEISLWIFFVFIWYFLWDFNGIIAWNVSDIIQLLFWLWLWFLSFVYTVYDILYLEIPENILLQLVIWIVIFLWCAAFIDTTLLPDIYTTTNNLSWDTFALLLWLCASIGWLYAIMLAGLDEKYDLLILSWIIIGTIFIKSFLDLTISSSVMLSSLVWVLIIFTFFFLQIFVSKWRWMWGWDLRIAIVLWLLLGHFFIGPWLFLTYISWSVIGIFVIVLHRLKKEQKGHMTEIPFGPFLSIWLFATLFFQDDISRIVQNYFLL